MSFLKLEAFFFDKDYEYLFSCCRPQITCKWTSLPHIISLNELTEAINISSHHYIWYLKILLEWLQATFHLNSSFLRCPLLWAPPSSWFSCLNFLSYTLPCLPRFRLRAEGEISPVVGISCLIWYVTIPISKSTLTFDLKTLLLVPYLPSYLCMFLSFLPFTS